jgi:integrase
VVAKRRGKRFLWEKKPGCWYVRRAGKYFPLRDDKGRWHLPDTPDGDAIYWAILTGRQAEAKRSFGAALALLRQSDRWAALSPRTRKDLEPVLEYLVEKIGKRDIARITTADIYQAMDANKHRVRFANYIPVAVSLVCKVVIRLRWRTDNPALGVEKLAVPEARKQPHHVWTDAAVARFRADASPLARLIFELGIGTAQRPGDLVGFTWGDWDGDNLRLRQNKTGKPLVLPCTDALKAALAAAKASLGFAPHPSRAILTKPDGNPMGYRYMSAVMAAERKRLGVELHDLHAMRYRAVKELAWAGCTDDEIMAYSGHASKAMVDKYAGEARQEMRARQAKEKRR